MSKPIRSTSRTGLGIVNPYGEMWTTQIFHTHEEAEAHFNRFWAGVKHAPSFSDFQVVPARTTTVALQEKHNER